MLAVDAIDHVVLNVRNVEASARWYVAHLGMERREQPRPDGTAPRVSLHFGQQKINLRPISASQDEWFTGHAPMPGSDDLCFLTQSPPEAVVAHFAAAGLAIEVGPVDRSGARGTLRSVYVRDPDGNLVEVASYA